MRSMLCAGLAILSLLLNQSTAQGEILFYEGFDYAIGNGQLVGQSGGFGFNATAWTVSSDSQTTGIQNAGVVAAGSIGFSDFATAGNVGQVQNDSDPQGFFIASRQLPASFSIPVGTTVYQSFLFQQTVDGAGTRDVSTGYSSTAGGIAEAVHNRVNTAFGFNDPDAVAFGYDATTENLSLVYPPLASVLVINKLENLNGAGSQTGTQWILSEANFDAIKAGGVTEAELNANNLGLITDTASGVTLAGGDFFQLRTRTQTSEPSNAFFDEIKLFTDLNDLQVIPASVPEPSAISLIAAMGCLAVTRRHRSKGIA